jgi:hypothetical protein
MKNSILLCTLFSIIILSNSCAQPNAKENVPNFNKNINKRNIKSTSEHYYIALKKRRTIKKDDSYVDLNYGNSIFISFNRMGDSLKIIRLNNSDTLKKTLFIYQENSLKEKKIFNSKNNLLTTLKYVYNSEGKLYLKEKYSDNLNISTDTFKYGDTGKLELRSTSDAKEKLLFAYLYDFDSNDNLIAYSSHNYHTRDFTKTTYKYNSLGDIMEKNTVINERFQEKKTFKETFEYKYDKYNNWIEKIIYKDGKPQYIIERSIQYW